MSTETYEKINAKDKPVAEDFVYVYSEIEDGGFRKVSKAMLKVLLGVATKLSELENDKAFITKTVSDLENYYSKSDTYSKDEIDNRISLIPRFDVQVVSSLPTTNISETTVYLVSSGDDSDNLYTEYINVNGLWEILGTQKIASVENAVLYTEQSLTDEQKAQARVNIGAVSEDDVSAKVKQAISEQTHFRFVKVDALPDIGEENVIYLVPGEQGEENIYEEYLFVDGVPELIGNTQIDLSGYAPKATTLAGYGITDGATKEEVGQIRDTIADLGVGKVKLEFWTPPEQPNTWATTDDSGKTGGWTTGSDAFVDEFYNKYIGEYDSNGNKNASLQVIKKGEDEPTYSYKVTRSIISKDTSGTYNIYEYVFSPTNYKKTIFLSSLQHAYEIIGGFSLARLMYYIMKEPSIHPSIRYIRDNVRIVVIPILNPWGFSQTPKKYGNINGVNPSYNFDWYGDKWEEYETYTACNTTEWNQKGTEPMTVLETLAMANTLKKYKNELSFWIDCHTGVGWNQDVWCYSCFEDKTFRPKVLKTAEWLSEQWRNEGKTELINRLCEGETSMKLRYSYYYLGVPCATLEYVPMRFGGNHNGSMDLFQYLRKLANFIIGGLNTLEGYTENDEFSLLSFDKIFKSQRIEYSNDGEIISCTSIVLDKNILTFDDASKQSLMVTVEPKDTTDEIVWTTNPTGIVSVNQEGVVTPLKVGTTVITATCGKQTANCEVTVNSANIPTLRVNNNTINYVNGFLKYDDTSIFTERIEVEGDTVSVSSDTFELLCRCYDSNGYYIGAGGSEWISNGTFTLQNGTKSIALIGSKSDKTTITESDITGSVTINGNTYVYSYDSALSCYTDGGTLTCELGIIQGSDGMDADSTTRFRAVEFIEVPDLTDIKVYSNFEYWYVFRAYDENKNYIGMVQPTTDNTNNNLVSDNTADREKGWCTASGTITKSRLTTMKYVRLMCRNADDSEITSPIEGSIIIGAVEYTLNGLV